MNVISQSVSRKSSPSEMVRSEALRRSSRSRARRRSSAYSVMFQTAPWARSTVPSRPRSASPIVRTVRGVPSVVTIVDSRSKGSPSSRQRSSRAAMRSRSPGGCKAQAMSFVSGESVDTPSMRRVSSVNRICRVVASTDQPPKRAMRPASRSRSPLARARSPAPSRSVTSTAIPMTAAVRPSTFTGVFVICARKVVPSGRVPVASYCTLSPWVARSNCWRTNRLSIAATVASKVLPSSCWGLD